MVAETASAEHGGDKATWMSHSRAAIKSRFPQLGAVIWFQDDKETDWRVDSSPRALAAYRAWVHDPYFNFDTRGVSLAFRRTYRLRRALRRGVTATVGSGRPFRIVLRAHVGARTARRYGLSRGKRVAVAHGRASVGVAGTRRVSLRFSARARNRLRSTARRVVVRVRALAVQHGKPTTVRRAFTLVR
jgi:hypothetical protein